MKYQKIDLSRDAKLLPSLVNCYREVFGAEPWNEWWRCYSCGHHWGAAHHHENGSPECCDTPAHGEFWSIEEVSADLAQMLERPGSSVWVALDGDKVVGFCMGYILPEAEFDEHLSLKGVAESFRNANPDATEVAYLDDIGVLVSYQGRHIGHDLLEHWLRHVEADTVATHSILRTQTMPPTVAHKWYSSLGYSEIAHYRDHKERVIMAAPLSAIIEAAIAA